ncbi:hypothetical protein [Streptomyces sp. NPDC059460]|uniref:hypothetical protein n=1 Tax=Streptomyces sp. NPDC059460 TaxID=3346840 RepID=UPI0036AB726B
MIAFIVRPVEQVSSKLLFSGLFQQRPRGVRVANRGLRIESEDLGEVEGVGAMDEGLFELPVDAELFQGGGLADSAGSEPVTSKTATTSPTVLTPLAPLVALLRRGEPAGQVVLPAAGGPYV